MRRLLFTCTLLLCAVVGGFSSPVSHAQDAQTPVLRVSDGDLVWNDVAVGTTASKTVVVSNTGGGTFGLTAPAIQGGDSADFSVASTTCTGAQLTTGQSCSVTVAFTPKVRSTRVSHLRVATTTAGCASYVTLAGSGAGTTSAPHPEKHSGFGTACTGATQAGQTPATSAPSTIVVNPTGGVLGTSDSGSPICGSRRVIRIHWRAPKGRAFKRGTFSVKTKGRTFKPKYVTKGKRKGQYYADLTFKGLRVGRYAVKIKGKLSDGKTFKKTRHFVTCISGKTPK